MAITELYSGTEAIGATEHSLTTDTSGPDADTTAAKVWLVMDLSDMVAGDQLQIKAYEKARSGDTQRPIFTHILDGAQPDSLYMTREFPMMHGWDFTLDALAGTITVLWSIRTEDSPSAIQNADALLDRNMATGTDSGGRTVRNALRALRNKVAISAGTATIYKEDDSTSAWTSSITTDAAAEPIIGSDPA